MFRFGDSELQMPTIIPNVTIDRVDATYHLVSITFKLSTNRIDYLDSILVKYHSNEFFEFEI